MVIMQCGNVCLLIGATFVKKNSLPSALPKAFLVFAQRFVYLGDLWSFLTVS